MAAIDKIYVNSYQEYVLFKEWCEKQPPLKDKYGNKGYIKDYLFQVNENEINQEEWSGCVMCAPYYIDAYIIRNCPLDFIQNELKFKYGYWDEKFVKEAYETVKNRTEVKEGLPFWFVTLEDFVFDENGNIDYLPNYNSSYSKILRNKLYTLPFTNFKYKVGKHFKCIQKPKFINYNKPLNKKRWFVSVNLINDENMMWYSLKNNKWDFDDEWIVNNGWISTLCAKFKTIKAVKRAIIKWKLPIGTIVNVKGRYVFEEYKFVVTK